MSRGVCVTIVPDGFVLSMDEAVMRAMGTMYVLPPDVKDFTMLQGFLASLPGFPSSFTCRYLRTFEFGSIQTQGWAAEGEIPEEGVVYVKVVNHSPATASVTVRRGPSLDSIFDEWNVEHGGFITNFLQQGGVLPLHSVWAVPLDTDGRPSILFHKLQDRWTRGSDAWRLLDYTVHSKKSSCIPLMGVSGCGKTRTLLEILAAKWGFFWTAGVGRNGGSRDVELVGKACTGVDSDCRLHFETVTQMKKLIVARLLVLQYVLTINADLTPEQWLLLQIDFRRYCNNVTEEPYLRLAGKLIADYDFKDDDLVRLWDSVSRRLSCRPILVMDEAQMLNGEPCFRSPQTLQRRAKFSPIVKAMMDLGAPVFVSGTEVSFLELEDNLVSIAGKLKGVTRLPQYVIKFDKWEKHEQVYEFCTKHLPVLVLTPDDCEVLLDRFKGRKRYLVSCLEELLLNGCCFRQEIVESFYAEVTAGESIDCHMSLYAMVADFFRKGKGTFRFHGRDLSARDLIVQAVNHYYFSNRVGLVLDSTEAHLLVSGLGSCEKIRSWNSTSTYEINEPMVLEAMKNYCLHNNHLELHLRVLMNSMSDDPAACGNLWEKMITIHVPRFLDRQMPMKDWPPFKGLDLQSWNKLVPEAVGRAEHVWRENLQAPLVTYLMLPPNERPMFFMFSTLSGPDVMLFVRVGDLLIPVFLQLKLRVEAQGTTNPSKMYKRMAKEVSKTAIPALLDACFYGCISLVVSYPACDPKPAKWSTGRLVGYMGKCEVEEVFCSELCDFLAAIKSDFPDYKTYKTQRFKNEATEDD